LRKYQRSFETFHVTQAAEFSPKIPVGIVSEQLETSLCSVSSGLCFAKLAQ
jgi:hypothetical protein